MQLTVHQAHYERFCLLYEPFLILTFYKFAEFYDPFNSFHGRFC